MARPKTIIIIGGNGFMGGAFNRFLKKLEISTIIIGRKVLTSDECSPNYYALSQLDLMQPATFIDLDRDNYIVDFAYTSIPNTSFEDPVKDFSENLFNIVQYLEFAKRINVKKYIYVSSGGTVYGNLGDNLLKENDPNFPISPYGITKLACERYVHMYAEVHGVPGVIARPANIFGPGQLPFRGQGLVATIMASIVKEIPVKVFGEGLTIRDYLYIDDLNRALLDILNFGQIGEIYNIGTGIGTSVNQILYKIEEIIKPDTLIRKSQMPGRPFDIHSNILNYQKLKELNNWMPATALDKGLLKTWEWINQYLNITRS